MARRTPWILRGVARLAPPLVAGEQPESARLEVSESSTSFTGESHADTTDADASVLANYPHSRAAWVITRRNY